MRKNLLLIPALFVSVMAHAAFVDGTTDQVSATKDEPTRPMPTAKSADDVTQACIAHFRSIGFNFYDKVQMDTHQAQVVEQAVTHAKSEIKPEVKVVVQREVETQYIPVESCPPKPKKVPSKKSKKTKKPATTPDNSKSCK